MIATPSLLEMSTFCRALADALAPWEAARSPTRMPSNLGWKVTVLPVAFVPVTPVQ